MTVALRQRLDRIEATARAAYLDTAQRHTERERAAAEFVNRITRYAESYPEDAAATPLDSRVAHFSPAQHYAWALRFQPETADLAEIMALHDLPIPAGGARHE